MHIERSSLFIVCVAVACAVGALQTGACSSTGTGSRGENIETLSHATFMHAGFGAGPAVFTDATGHLLEERRFEPFGESIDAHLRADGIDTFGRADLVSRDLDILNKRVDVATGWSDHGARWLAPETGRWLSPDPPVEAPDAKFMAAPWALHPYQYVDQNPVSFWDPDGREPAAAAAVDVDALRQALVDRVPKGPALEAALVYTRKFESNSPIYQNTILNIANGAVHIGYLEDLEHPANEASILASKHLSASDFRVFLNPTTGSPFVVANHVKGTENGNWTFGRRSLGWVEWLDLLPHEQVHYWNDHNSFPANSIERYRGEFLAYFVTSATVNLDQRAAEVKSGILKQYPELGDRYATDPIFKFQVDIHTRPNQDKENSWQRPDNVDNHSY